MLGVIKPKSIKQTDGIRALELEEQQKLTNYLLAVPIYDEPYRNVFLFQMFFGLRIGEALALQLSDINLQKNKPRPKFGTKDFLRGTTRNSPDGAT